MHDDGLWERCAAFHGHICGGLAIGYKAAVYAARSLGLRFSSDEELVCIAENDACGIDAIQVALGCTLGKEEALRYFLESEPEKLFKASPATLPLPENARIFAGRACAGCGETVAESQLVICADGAFCKDCRRPYDRFRV